MFYLIGRRYPETFEPYMSIVAPGIGYEKVAVSSLARFGTGCGVLVEKVAVSCQPHKGEVNR